MKRLLLAILLFGAAQAAYAQSAVPANGYPPPNLSTINSSAVITVGGTFQTVLAAVSSRSRRSLTIQNNNSADTCWVFVGSGSASAAKSIALAPGQAYTRYFPYVPTDLIQATCANNNDTLYVDTQ